MPSVWRSADCCGTARRFDDTKCDSEDRAKRNNGLYVHERHLRTVGRAGSRDDVVFEYRPTYRRTDSKGDRIEVASIRGHKLGRGFSLGGIQHGLGLVGGAARAMARVTEAAMDDRGDSAI